MLKIARIFPRNKTMTHHSWWLFSPFIASPPISLSNTMWRVARHKKYKKTHYTTNFTQIAQEVLQSWHDTPHTKLICFIHVTLHTTHKTLQTLQNNSTHLILLPSVLRCQFTPQITITENWWDTMSNNFLTLGWELGKAGEKHL